MNTENHPFYLNLGSLLPQSAGYKREFPFEFSKIQLTSNFVLHQFHGLVTATRTQQGLLVQGKFDGKLELECVRCLSKYNHLLQWEITKLYVFSRHDATKEDLILPNNAEIDLGDFVIEEVQLDIPINPACRNDCQGLCQTCGTNLNLSDCDHKDTPLDETLVHSPFSGLKDLL